MSHIRPILFGCFVLLVRGARADVTGISTCPYKILQPGQYHITKDLTCPVNGIQIMASDVQLHFDGHTLNGMGTGEFGVLVIGSNNSIFGSGTGGGAGDSSGGSNGGNSGSSTGGGAGDSSGGSNDDNSGSGTVTRFQFGIVVESSNDTTPTRGNRIVNITVTNSLSQGIILVTTVQNTIINCTVNNNSLDGIFLGSSSSFNTLISNTANRNGTSGIELFDTTNNKLIANRTDGNGFNGIVVDFGFSGNLIQASNAANNIPFDLADFNGGCDANTWKSNHFGTANQPCID
jgi:parallel beta-helix repeat protein